MNSPLDTAALRDHLASCARSSARWPVLQLATHATSRFAGSRVVTTAAMGSAVLGAAWLIWF